MGEKKRKPRKSQKYECMQSSIAVMFAGSEESTWGKQHGRLQEKEKEEEHTDDDVANHMRSTNVVFSPCVVGVGERE